MGKKRKAFPMLFKERGVGKKSLAYRLGGEYKESKSQAKVRKKIERTKKASHRIRVEKY